MAPRREILDSDDDDDELSPVKSTANFLLPGDTTPTVDEASNTADTRETRSTDPTFFQNVYDEQQTTADGRMSAPDMLSNSVDDGANIVTSPASMTRLRRQANERNSSSLTSLTDPRNRPKRSERKDVIDLTQVTTPGRERSSARLDLWDVPSSPAAQTARDGAAGPSSANKSHGKRKRGQDLSSLEVVDNGGSTQLQSPTQHSVPPAAGNVPGNSPRLAKKRSRREPRVTLSRPSQEVDLIMVPRSGDPTENPNCSKPDDIPGTVVTDTLDATSSTSLYVAQSVLTASQKRQYEFVSLSSEVDKDDVDTNLPRSLGNAGPAYVSSGATTIAYPTPTQYASSGRIPAPEAAAEPPSTGRRRRGRVEILDPSSSPDIISQPSTTAPRKRKRGAASPGPDEALQNLESTELGDQTRPTSRRGTKCRTSISGGSLSGSQPPSLSAWPNYSEDPATEAGERANRNDIRPGSSPSLPLNLAAEEPSTIPQDEPKPKKKRGRKKKEVKSQELVEEPVDDRDPTANKTPEPVAGGTDGADGASKVKRRRGRPRKSDTPKSLDPQAQSVGKPGKAHGEQDIADGQDPEAVSASAAGGGQDEPVVQHQVLKEIDQNSRAVSQEDAAGTAAGGETASLAKESKPIARQTQQETGKGDATSAQGGKVQYRVGLSKRSRIAPLLKIMRK